MNVDIKEFKQEKIDIKKIQEEKLREMQAVGRSFQYSRTLGDELEDELLVFLNQIPELNDYFSQYDYPEVLRLNILEIVMSPIIQLAEMKNLGAAVIFAERVTKIEKNDTRYIQLFTDQISRLKLIKFNLSTGNNDEINIQLAISNLMRIFTYQYSIYSLHSNKSSLDLIDVKRQTELRKEASQYVRAVAKAIVVFLKQYALQENINLSSLKQNFLVEESKSTPSYQWKIQQDLNDQTENDARLALTYAAETFELIHVNILAYTNREKDLDIKDLQAWIDRGINFI